MSSPSSGGAGMIAARAALYLLAWLLIALFFASQTWLYGLYSGGTRPFGRALLYPLIDSLLWSVLAIAAYALSRRFPIERGRMVRALAVHGAAALGCAIVEGGLAFLLYWRGGLLAGTARPPGQMFGNLVVGKLHTNLLTYAIVVGVVHLALTHGKFRDRELAASRLETSLAEARLELLRAQLHPHFLFNTLHAISALMHRDVEAADRMLARLSDLLRMAIETAGAQEVALRREIEFVRGYLEIQRVRFGARLEVRLDMAPEVLDAAVPSLVLQPLVENAIRHGIAPRASGGRVEVRAERAGARLRLEVLDDGAGTRGGGAAGAGASAGPSTGVGLANTRARLEQLYGARQRFAAQDRESGGFAVTIELPFRAVEEPRSPDAAAAGAAS